MKRITSFSFVLITIYGIMTHSTVSAWFWPFASSPTEKVPETTQVVDVTPQVPSKPQVVPAKEVANAANVTIRKNITRKDPNFAYTTTSFFINNGKIDANKSVQLTCGSLSGKGYFCSPQITINVQKFDFKGTIECNGTCTINSKEPINENSFKRSGKGKFILNGKEVVKKSSKKHADKKSSKKTAHPPLQTKENPKNNQQKSGKENKEKNKKKHHSKKK